MALFSDSVKEFINVAGLSAKIKALEAELILLKTLQSSLGSESQSRKPGRPAGTTKAPKAKKSKRAPRGSVGDSILKFLAKKGEKGAHVKEIAQAVGGEPKNITAYFYTTGKKVKGVKRHGGNVFSFVPKDEAKSE